jgi:hypothetical protein
MSESSRSAAQSIYPHLPHDQGEPPQRQQPRLAEALFPKLVPPKPAPPNPYRESLLRHLRELNQQIDARLQREVKR